MSIYTLAALQKAIADHPHQWRPLVFTNGCFDLLHVGHCRYLTAAKGYGQRLIVGLNSDASVAALKPPRPGQPSRPIIPAPQRAELLATLKPVDGVVIFDQLRASALIAALQPDIYVKGGDYTPTTLPEYPDVIAYGGRVELIQVEIPTSTTAIIERIQATEQATI